MKRPITLLVVAWFWILIGLLLSTLFILGLIDDVTRGQGYHLIGLALLLLFGIFIPICGIYLLKLRPWARISLEVISGVSLVISWGFMAWLIVSEKLSIKYTIGTMLIVALFFISTSLLRSQAVSNAIKGLVDAPASLPTTWTDRFMSIAAIIFSSLMILDSRLDSSVFSTVTLIIALVLSVVAFFWAARQKQPLKRSEIIMNLTGTLMLVGLVGMMTAFSLGQHRNPFAWILGGMGLICLVAFIITGIKYRKTRASGTGH